MPKTALGPLLPLVLLGLLSACAIAPPANHPADPVVKAEASGSASAAKDSRSPLGLDYSPEARCSDNNLTWLGSERPHACQPQPGQACGASLNTCPARCQQCYDDDLGFIRRNLKVDTITIYQPNYYILKAAQRLQMKVVVGLMNDAVLGLAMPDTRTDCAVGGKPLYLCGSNYASAVIDGACIDTVGGDPFAPCVSRCAIRSDPARDCVKGDCSCAADSDCKGGSNRCLRGAYVAPLDNAATGEFLRDGTVVAIQLGNEFFKQCQIPQVPGQNQPCCGRSANGACRAWTINRQVYSTAARTLRQALDRRGLQHVKIAVGLVGKQGVDFCRGGAPPPGIDYISAHAYCDRVADVPPRWDVIDGVRCWQQAHDEYFAADQKACGAARTYLGESGFNSGCPSMANHDTLLKAERDYIGAMLAAQPQCRGTSDPAAPLPSFLFEFADTGPREGCLSGCSDRKRCYPSCCCKHRCSATAICAPECPSCFGNGYFGLFHTPGYRTAGFPPEPKFDPMPSLLCPVPQ